MERWKHKHKIHATIEYKSLGTITIEQFTQALWEDLKALQDFYGLTYLTGAQLIIRPTNEYGDPVYMRHPDGRQVRRYDTHYYRPACLDYEL